MNSLSTGIDLLEKHSEIRKNCWYRYSVWPMDYWYYKCSLLFL